METQEIQAIKQRFGIIGNSPRLNRAIEIAATVAGTESSVLIVGESGSGKETFSKIIHQLSARKHGEFIAINCGAIPEGTINSELFGHEKGAFTGASEARKGYFEVTNDGTIFLDEVAEMPPETQAMLLRVLEYGEFLRVGSNKVKKTNVRVVAATNVDLQERVAQGRFREDLYFRFSITIEVPPLRDRGEDVELLFRKFSVDFAERNRTKPVLLDDSAKQLLLNFRFPGNIRQLKNIVEQVSVLANDRIIDSRALSEFLPSEHSSGLPVLSKTTGYNGSSNSDFSERDILYKGLFDLRNGMVDLGKEVTELKKMVLNILDSEVPNSEVYKDNKHLFHNIQDQPFKEQIDNASLLLHAHKEDNEEEEPKKNVDRDRNKEQKTFNLDDSIEDITHKMEDETLSLEKLEVEAIKKALQKNNNKRKYAARDLGISERTLYRKIKQYGIDD